MKEAVVNNGPTVQIRDAPIPKAGPGEVVIKVEACGTNPKDWKTWWVPEANLPINMGDDISGTVHETGSDVVEFSVGDRVFAFHPIQAPHGGFAEYAIAPAYTTAHLPSHTSFEEAATIPLAATTAALALFRVLGTPQPWSPASPSTKLPIFVNGGSSAVGAFAIKFATLANVHPIITTAGAGKDYVSSLLDATKGDMVIDYRTDRKSVDSSIKSALEAAGVIGFTYSLDAISEGGTWELSTTHLTVGGKLAHVLPLPQGHQLSQGTTANLVKVGDVHGTFGDVPGGKDFGYIIMRALSRFLERDAFKGHPYQVVPGGLNAVLPIFENLKASKNSALKYVFRVRDTDGICS